MTGRIAPSSRYAGIETAKLATADGVEIVYLRRRLLPDPDKLAVVGERTVKLGDRLDRIAAESLGDPELFWRICDANRAMRPDELVETSGRRLRIALPPGFTGGEDA